FASPSAPTTRSTRSSWRCARSCSRPGGRLLRVLVFLARTAAPAAVVVAGLRARRHGHTGADGGRRRRLALLEVARLLVHPRVHVVARLEDRPAALAHDVILRVLLRGEDDADRLPVLVGERDAQVRRAQTETREVARRLGGDARAAEVFHV